MAMGAAMQPETWRPIEGHPGYEISSIGRVRTWKTPCPWVRKSEPILKVLRVDKRGYRYVSVSTENKSYSLSVSRLVAKAFIPGDRRLEVAHLDNNPKNNHKENLKWVTRQENESHKILFGTVPKGESHVSSKLPDKSVAAIVLLARNGVSKKLLAIAFGVSVQTVERYGRSGSRTNPYYKPRSA